jgi:CRISPR/Cas system-associated exonuclease Cas4 (RecB family)
VINAYRYCPRRVRLQHLDRVHVPGFQRIDFTMGNAAHLVLKHIAQTHALGRRPPDDDQVMEMIRQQVPRQPFPSEAEWTATLREVRTWVRRGRRYIERTSIRRWVLIEKNLTRDWNLLRDRPPFTIMARPDLIVQHEDEDGVPVVEIIDYKTGAPSDDPMPILIMRLVARELLDGLVGNADIARVVFTYLWLETDESHPVDVTAEYIEYYWPNVQRQMRGLTTESEWSPRPSPGCRFCPFHNHVCQEKIPYDPWS